MNEVLLYLHLFSLALLLMNAGVVHVLEIQAARAATGAEARAALRTSLKLGPVFGVGSLLLVLTGGWLADRAGYELSSAWIVASFVALVVINGVGAGYLGRRLDGHVQALAADGPLSDAERAAVQDRVLAIGGWFNTAVAFGIIFVMTVKPGAAGAVVALLVAAAVGVGIGVLQHSLLAGRRAAQV